MGYGLGVDLGTSYTAVAIGRNGRTRIVPLSDDPISGSSLIAVRPAGSVLVREVDETVPVVLGGRPYPPVAVLAEALRSTLTAVTASEGEFPEQVVLTCPAVWGPSRRQQFGEVSRRAGLTSVTVVSEPEAAVTGLYDARKLAEEDLVLVYDIGGVTVDMTVIRVTDSGMEILGLPEGADGAGGADFDDLILAHVDRLVGGALSELDLHDPVSVGVLTGVRAECVRAKEALSRLETATIRVIGLAEVVGLAEEMEPIRLTRADFEAMIRVPLTSTLTGLRRVLDSAGVQPEHLSAVVLVGGSSRIPLVSRMLTKSLGRPIVVDEHPQHCVALGAAAIADGTSTIAGGARITPGAPPVTNSIPTVAAALAAAKSAGRPADSARPPESGRFKGRGRNKAESRSTETTVTKQQPAVAPPVKFASTGPATLGLPSTSPPPVVDKMLAATFPGAVGAQIDATTPTLARRAGGHRVPKMADWRRWFGYERYSLQQRRWRVVGITAVTALLLGGATYAISPLGSSPARINTEIVDSPYVPGVIALPATTEASASPTSSSPAIRVIVKASATATKAPTTTPPPKRSSPPPSPTTSPAGAVSRSGVLVGPAGRCLDVFNGWDEDGTAVQIFGCNGSPAQRWTVAADGTLQAQGKCLQIVDGRWGESRLEINGCNGQADQQWVVNSGSVVNPESRQCLDVRGTDRQDQTPVIMSECDGTPSQTWSLRS